MMNLVLTAGPPHPAAGPPPPPSATGVATQPALDRSGVTSVPTSASVAQPQGIATCQQQAAAAAAAAAAVAAASHRAAAVAAVQQHHQ